MPVAFVAVLVVELLSTRISGSYALATHDVAGAGALVEVAVGFLRVERQTARLGTGNLRWFEHLAESVLKCRQILVSGTENVRVM